MDKVISFLLGEAVGETVGWRITPALPKNNLNYPQVSYLCNYQAITALNGTAITPKQYQVIVGIWADTHKQLLQLIEAIINTLTACGSFCQGETVQGIFVKSVNHEVIDSGYHAILEFTGYIN